MRVLIACEFSGIVRNAFAKLGHYALSCDLLDTEQECIGNSTHYKGNIQDILFDKRCIWDLMIAHPPCTYITNAGVRHLHSHVVSKKGNKASVSGSLRWTAMKHACDFFNILKNAKIPRICIENPIPHKYARDLIGPYTQIIQPWMFGHLETKATCLWLKNLPKLVATNNVKEEMLKLPKKESHKIHYASPGKDRWKIRSRTFEGIGTAMALQWSSL